LRHGDQSATGRRANPGGIVQGIGAVLFEHCLYDEAGQLLNAI